MSAPLTPPLTREGWAEILDEMSRPPLDTPARRAMFARARVMADLRRRLKTDPNAVVTLGDDGEIAVRAGRG